VPNPQAGVEYDFRACLVVFVNGVRRGEYFETAFTMAVSSGLHATSGDAREPTP